MNLNITVNEAGSQPPLVDTGKWNVRLHFNETDAGHVSGVFGSREAAEAYAQKAICRDGVLKTTFEEVV